VEGWNTGWDVNWCCSGDGEAFDFYHSHPDFDTEEITEYAWKKNIRIIGHHETGGQIQNYESQLDSAFSYANRNDIRVIKTGYVNDVSQNISRIAADGKVYKEWHHGQYMVEHFRKVIETAAKYQVSLVPHEPIKDTGIRRTYPNILSREGAKGQEFNGFMSTKDNNKPNHTTILPFTRLLSAQWTIHLESSILKNIGIIALMIEQLIQTIIYRAPYQKNWHCMLLSMHQYRWLRTSLKTIQVIQHFNSYWMYQAIGNKQ
jgi:hypothetical protein